MPQSFKDERLLNWFQKIFEKVMIWTGRPRVSDFDDNAPLDFEREIPIFEEEELQREWQQAWWIDAIY
jgi:hypothetical protein